MWPFRDKYIKSKTLSIEQQASRFLELKSVTIPQAAPSWNLFYKKNERWNSRIAVEEGYNASAVVYTCVEKRASLMSSVPWFVERKLSDGTFERVEDSPLKDLLESPNPTMSWMELMHETSQWLDIAGTCYWSEIKGGIPSYPFELWLLPEHDVEIKPGKKMLIDGYKYTPNGGKGYEVKSDDMVHLRRPNPRDRYHGMPVLMSASKATDIDVESGRWQKSSLENRNIADIHVEVPHELQEDQIKGIRKQLRERGGSDNARDALVSSGKINHLSRSAVELDFSNSKKNIWAEICATFGLSLSALGFTENVNLSNADAMQKQIWTNTIIPNLELVKRQLNRSLAAEFGEDIKLNYDLSGIEALQEDFGAKIDNATKLYSMGFSIEAINKRLEMGFDEADLPDETEELEVEEGDEEESIDSEEVSEDVKRLLKSVGYGD